MQISLNWLNDYLQIENLEPEKIAETLTDLGLEVERIEKHSILKGDYDETIRKMPGVLSNRSNAVACNGCQLARLARA